MTNNNINKPYIIRRHNVLSSLLSTARLVVVFALLLATLSPLLLPTVSEARGAPAPLPAPFPAPAPGAQRRPAGGAVGGLRTRGPSQGHHLTLGHWSHHHRRPSGPVVAAYVRG